MLAALFIAAGNLDGCQFFPDNAIFNTPITTAPLSNKYTTSDTGLDPSTTLHLDFDGPDDPSAGIPYNSVAIASAIWSTLDYDGAPDESDCGDGNNGDALVHNCQSVVNPVMPIPASPNVEGESSVGGGKTESGGDGHLLVLDNTNCHLWEAGDATFESGTTWSVYSTAFWDLSSNAMRTATWTSSDAAGFAILPLLTRGDEANAGAINHAVRFTLPKTGASYVWPASHKAGNGGTLPMGTVFRLRADYPVAGSTQSQAILTMLKTYGMYLADNGGSHSTIYETLDPSPLWDNDSITSQVQKVTLADFEVVDVSSLQVAANSYEATGNPASGGGSSSSSGSSGGTTGSVSAGGTGGASATSGGSAASTGTSSGGNSATESSGKKGCNAGGEIWLPALFALMFRRRALTPTLSGCKNKVRNELST